MRSRWVLAALGVPALAVVAFLIFRPSTKADAPAKAKSESASAQLPLDRVLLFSSGVGHFLREGKVEGNARVDLSFPVSDINDLIKSMTLRDLNGGHITTVSYDSNAPIERTLKSFAVDLTGNPSFAQILTRARGEKVEVALTNAGAGAAATLSGTIVGVEKQKQAVGKDTVEVNVLNLWCADGVRAVRLSDVQRIRFTNAIMESEFKKALETLARSHDTQKKAVSILCAGEGKRTVQVGYVVENPIWKTSYRLVLSSKKGEKPYLQGWAVVENPSDEDWKDVRMALISGRPISFQMDLYQPLYVNRPVVVPELFASLRPVAYSGDMTKKARIVPAANNKQAEEEEEEEEEQRPMRFRSRKDEEKDRQKKIDRALEMRFGGRPQSGDDGRKLKEELKKRLDLGRSVSSAATAAKLGDYFQYTIDKRVTLPRQKSALLPIVAKEVEGTKVSIYNERTQAKFPLLGLKLKNTSGLHLMQGPITVFEGSAYAGDARILDLQPGEERLISYAVDLGTEVNPVPSQDGGRIVSLKAVKGIIHTTHKQRQGKTYTIKNRSEQARLVLVEHPVNNAFSLVETAKPAETARDFYRFEVRVPAGATRTLRVNEERQFKESVSIASEDDERIRFFMSQSACPAKVKQGLQKAIDLRSAVSKTTSDLAEQRKQLAVITADQDRMRKNLKEVPTGSKLHKIYLDKMEKQEKDIDKHQADIKRLLTLQGTQRQALDDFLVGFSAGPRRLPRRQPAD